jgi:hypothetical protein
VRDARDRLAKRRHFFGLEQLLIQIARLIIEPFSLTHVPKKRFDSKRRAPAHAVGARRDFDPDRLAVPPF